MNLYTELEKLFLTIEKALSEAELLEFMNTPVGSLYAIHYNLAMWIKDIALSEDSRLHSLFLENQIEQVEIMLDTILMLFHYHIYGRIKKEGQDNKSQNKSGSSLIWCEENQVYTYNFDHLTPQYVIVK